jgi:peptide/nickel transport system substrate-binding protein
MAKKILWILISCLMVLSLVLTSCGGDDDDVDDTSSSGTEDTSTDSTDDEEEDDGISISDEGPVSDMEADADKPQYGGELVLLRNTDISTWHPGAAAGQGIDGVYTTMVEQILGITWDKGPAGTNETNFIGGVEDYRYLAGNLVESFETPDVGVWVLHVRQGVHYSYVPGNEASELVGGREMTAEDIAYSIEYMRDNPTSPSSLFEPELMQNLYIERIDEWTIEVHTPKAPTTGYLWIMGGGGVQYVWPKEYLEAYAGSTNWYDVVGTGPYIITDYIPGSAAKFVRNDNYWDVNPVGAGTGDQLPYPDSMKLQIVPDYSARLAALRTGQADFSTVDLLEPQDFDSIQSTNPDIKYVETITAPQQLAGNINLTESPFSDVRVRQAMMMAIDHPAIVEEFYDGRAELLDSPARKWYKSIYTPLEEQNETVQKLYGYDLDEAKDLMDKAGWGDGFEVDVQMTNSTASETAISLLISYLEDLNITINPIVLEPSIFNSVFWNHDYDTMMLSASPGGDGSLFVRYSMGYFRGSNAFNMSFVNDPTGSDPVIEHAYDVQCANVMVNYAEADAITKETWKYVLEQAFLIPLPAPWSYRIWQPWVRNYYGSGDIKFGLKWLWIDEEMKAAMK